MYGKTSTNNNIQMKNDNEALNVDTKRDFNIKHMIKYKKYNNIYKNVYEIKTTQSSSFLMFLASSIFLIPQMMTFPDANTLT